MIRTPDLIVANDALSQLSYSRELRVVNPVTRVFLERELGSCGVGSFSGFPVRGDDGSGLFGFSALWRASPPAPLEGGGGKSPRARPTRPLWMDVPSARFRPSLE